MYKVHFTPKVKDVLKKKNIHLLLIPAGMTSELQIHDLVENTKFKKAVRKECEKKTRTYGFPITQPPDEFFVALQEQHNWTWVRSTTAGLSELFTNPVYLNVRLKLDVVLDKVINDGKLDPLIRFRGSQKDGVLLDGSVIQCRSTDGTNNFSGKHHLHCYKFEVWSTLQGANAALCE